MTEPRYAARAQVENLRASFAQRMEQAGLPASCRSAQHVVTESVGDFGEFVVDDRAICLSIRQASF